MKKFMHSFRASEDGAVTVDWVVLTAAVVGLVVLAYTQIETGGVGLADNTSTFMDDRDPG